MKTLKKSQDNWFWRKAHCLLILSAFGLSAQAATEQWLGVPGVSASTNWTDSANWSPDVDQTYYNQVQFIGSGTNPNTDFSVNNVLDGTSGVAQMPIWELDYVTTNANYTTLINPGVTLTLGAGWGSLYVGADALNNSTPAPANAFETITLTGAGGTFTVGGNIYLGQGSTTPEDSHNVTLDLSGLDTFNDTGGQILVASAGLERANGTFYLAKTNQISLGDNFQISNQSMSNSLPCAVYLGQVNNIGIGSSDLTVGGLGAAAGALLEFNPAFVSVSSVPTAFFYGTQDNGRIVNFLIGNENGAPEISGSGLCDFTGGNVTMLVDTMQLGEGGGEGANATGVLTFENGNVNVNNAIIGNQAIANGGTGVGVVNLNRNTSGSATLQVNNILTLGSVTGGLTAGTAGTININGGNLIANVISNGGGSGAINITNGTVTLNGTAGTPGVPIGSIALVDSTLNLPLTPGTNNIVTTDLTVGGTANVINITAAPLFPSYPVQIPLIKYSGTLNGSFNVGLGTLPLLYAGHLVNDTVNSSIDLVLTAGSSSLVWSGTDSDNWDTTTANWAGSTIYSDGDFVQFLDGAHASTVNLATTLMPANIVISNTTPAYAFTGNGALTGSSDLVKEGPGTLVIDNSGSNIFSGGTIISNGVIQVGNNDTAGNLPGSITDNGSLVYARTDNNSVPNSISGTGSFTQAGAGSTLLLNGNNSFSGNVVVTNDSTLQPGSPAGLGSGSGSVIVANGSTYDANGFASTKPIIVSGSGVSGNGALTDTGGPIYDNPSFGLAPVITLAGDTTFGYPTRWDLGSPAIVSTGGHPYNLTLNGANGGYFEWKDLSVDPALANITINSGTLGIVGATTLGNPSDTLTLVSSAGITLYNSAANVSVNKNVDFQSGATIAVGGGNDVMSGGMILESGVCSFAINGGTSLNLSNTLSGTGYLYLNQGTGSLILSGNSPSYTGIVSLYSGSVVLNGSIGGGIASQSGTIVTGTGTADGLVDISGALSPGVAGAAGTFNAHGGLVIEGGAVITNDLSTTVGGNNGLIQVNGDLTLNGNTIYINPTGGTLADGTYTLITYTGNFNGSLGTAATIYPTSYNLELANVTTTTPKQIQVIVSGTSQPSLLVWNNASSDGQWNVDSSANWSNVTTHVSSSVFNALDEVVFDNSILNASVPVTNIVIPSGQIVVPSIITNNSSVNYAISGAGTISGAGSLVKQGSGTLSISAAGNFTGPVAIGGGVLFASNNCLQSVSSITITNSSTLDLAGGVFKNNKPVTVSGGGVNNEGAIYSSVGNYPVTSLSITLAGDTKFGGSQRWDLATNSLITGSHYLTIDWSGGAGYGEWNTVNVGANVTGITLTNGGNIGMKFMDTAFQNPATVFTLGTNDQMTFYSGGFNGSIHLLSGAQIFHYTAPAGFYGSTLVMENNSSLTSYYNQGDTTPINSAVTLNGIVHFVIGNHNMVYTNLISGAGGFVEDYYDSQMVFSSSNTYSGPTVIGSNGNTPEVALTGNGSISHSSLIFFGGNSATVTHLDVSGRPDNTLTLADGQTLAGIGGINGNLTVSADAILSPAGTNTTIGITTGSNPVGELAANGGVTLDGTTVIKLNGSGTNDVVGAGGNITYGGTLNLVNINATALAAGNGFHVFNAATYTGSFTTITPTTPGTGLAWDTTDLNSTGVIKVVAPGSSGPVIGSPTVSGGQLIFSGTGGTNNGTYYVLTTTNLLTPLANWTPVATNQFGPTGAFSVTNAMVPGVPQHFYLIKQ